MSDVLIRGERQARTGLLWTDYGGHHVMTEAETGVMCLQAREPSYQEPGRGKEGSSLEPQESQVPLTFEL